MLNAIFWGIAALICFYINFAAWEIAAGLFALFAFVYLAFEGSDRLGDFLIKLARARSITPLNEFAKIIAPFNKEQLEALRRAGQFDMRAQLGISGLKLSLQCPDNHLIPYYSEDGNDLQTLLRDLSSRDSYPYLKVSSYSNNSTMQNHLRSFINAATWAGVVEPAFGNVAARWREGESPINTAKILMLDFEGDAK